MTAVAADWAIAQYEKRINSLCIGLQPLEDVGLNRLSISRLLVRAQMAEIQDSTPHDLLVGQWGDEQDQSQG